MEFRIPRVWDRGEGGRLSAATVGGSRAMVSAVEGRGPKGLSHIPVLPCLGALNLPGHLLPPAGVEKSPPEFGGGRRPISPSREPGRQGTWEAPLGGDRPWSHNPGKTVLSAK